jgi:hypothetical protein
MTLQNTAGAITAATATTPNTFVNNIVTYTITFTLTNRLIAGSFINIVFPV